MLYWVYPCPCPLSLSHEYRWWSMSTVSYVYNSAMSQITRNFNKQCKLKFPAIGAPRTHISRSIIRVRDYPRKFRLQFPTVFIIRYQRKQIKSETSVGRGSFNNTIKQYAFTVPQSKLLEVFTVSYLNRPTNIRYHTLAKTDVNGLIILRQIRYIFVSVPTFVLISGNAKKHQRMHKQVSKQSLLQFFS